MRKTFQKKDERKGLEDQIGKLLADVPIISEDSERISYALSGLTSSELNHLRFLLLQCYKSVALKSPIAYSQISVSDVAEFLADQ